MSVFMRGGSPFASSGASPWRNSDTSFGVNATAAAIRDAINTPSAWGYSAHNLLLHSGGSTGWSTNASPTNSGAGAAIDGAATHRFTATGSDSGYYRDLSVSPASGEPFVIATYFNRVSGTGNLTCGTSSGSRTALVVNPATGAIVSGPAGAYVLAVVGGWLAVAAYTGNGNLVSALKYGSAASTVFDVAIRAHYGSTLLPYVATTTTALGPTTPGYAIPGFAGARINAAARTSVAMQQRVDGVWEFSPHNLLLYTEDMRVALGWTQTNSTASISSSGGGFGGRALFALTENTATAIHRIQQSVSQTSGAAHSVTIRAAAVGDRRLQINAEAALGTRALFDLTGDGSVVQIVGTAANRTASISRVGSLYECRLTGTGTATGAAIFFQINRSISTTAADDSYTGDGTSGLLLSAPQFNIGPAATTYVPTTTSAVYAPAIDWLSGIGAYGLRSEPAATNQVRNSAAVGGTSPTNWSVAQANGITVTATSSDTMQGLPGVSYRVQGTATAGGYNAGIAVESNTGLAATSGQTWATSVFVALTSGSLLTSTVRLSQWESTDVGGFVAATRSTVRTVTGSLSRIEFINTLAGGATVARMQPRIEFLITNGETYDFTVFVACPQAELTSATSPILTYGASATRAADTLTVPDTAAGFIGQTMGTLAVEAVPKVIGNNGTLAINSANSTNDIDLRTNTVAQVTVGGSLLMSPSITAATANALSKAALAYTLRSSAASRNGGAATLTGDAPAFTQVQIGGYDGATTGNLNGHITRVRVTQDVLTPAALAAISA